MDPYLGKLKQVHCVGFQVLTTLLSAEWFSPYFCNGIWKGLFRRCPDCLVPHRHVWWWVHPNQVGTRLCKISGMGSHSKRNLQNFWVQLEGVQSLVVTCPVSWQTLWFCTVLVPAYLIYRIFSKTYEALTKTILKPLFGFHRFPKAAVLPSPCRTRAWLHRGMQMDLWVAISGFQGWCGS